MLSLIVAVLSLVGVCGAEHEAASRNEEVSDMLASIRVSAYAIDMSNRSAFEVLPGGRNTSKVGEILFFTALLSLDLDMLQGRRTPAEDPVRLWESIHEHLHRFSPCVSLDGATEIFIDSTAWFCGTPGSSDSIAGDIAAAVSTAGADVPITLPVFRVASIFNPCASRFTWRLTASSTKRTTLYFDQFTIWDTNADYSDLILLHSELADLFSVGANAEYCFTNTVWVLATCDGFGDDEHLGRMLCCDAAGCSWRPTTTPQTLPFYIAPCIDMAYLESVTHALNGAEADSDHEEHASVLWLIIAVSSLSVLLLVATAAIVAMRRRAWARRALAAPSSQLPGDLGSMRHQRESKSYSAQCPGGGEAPDVEPPHGSCSASLHSRSAVVGLEDETLSNRTPVRRSDITKPEIMSIINNDAFSAELDKDPEGDHVTEQLASAAARLMSNAAAATSPSAQHSVLVELRGAQPARTDAQDPGQASECAAATGASTSASDPLVTFLTELGQAHEDHALTLQRVIGRGTFGIVYQGQWKGLPVAVKRVELQVHPSEDIAAHPGVREAKLAMQLCHENIVSTYRVTVRKLRSEETTGPVETQTLVGAIRIEGELAHSYELFLVQELCDAGHLQTAIARGMLHMSGLPRLAAILRVALDISHGLYALHRNNIVHGDLKPENVLLSSCPARMGDACGLPFIAKLCDFGLSFAVGSGTHVSNMHVGTPIYAAPEVRSIGHLSKAADMYSMGVVLWELFTSISACVLTVDGVSQHPNLVHWSSPVGRQAPVSYVLLTVACLSPDRSTRPSASRARSVLEEVYETVCVGAVDSIVTFADSIRTFRNATGTTVPSGSQEELAEWLHYLSSGAQQPGPEQHGAVPGGEGIIAHLETVSPTQGDTHSEYSSHQSSAQRTYGSDSRSCTVSTWCGVSRSTRATADSELPVMQPRTYADASTTAAHGTAA